MITEDAMASALHGGDVALLLMTVEILGCLLIHGGNGSLTHAQLRELGEHVLADLVGTDQVTDLPTIRRALEVAASAWITRPH